MGCLQAALLVAAVGGTIRLEESPFRFNSSDAVLNAGAEWAKGQALAYVQPDAALPCYWAGLLDRKAFYLRDLAHQSLGAHIEATCATGTKVLTYKPLIPMGRRRRGAAAAEAGAADAERMGLREVGRGVFEQDGVSWTSGPIEYIKYELFL